MSKPDEDLPWPLDAEGPMGAWSEGECFACATFAPLPDLQLCRLCLGRWDRDLIRQRLWGSSYLAQGKNAEERESLRRRVIARFGEELEIFDCIPPSPPLD